MLNFKENQKDLSDLTRSVLYEEVPNQNLVRLTALVIGSGFLLFVVWMGLTNVNEVTRTAGEIIPSGYAQVVQHLEGGIVADILIEEGDLVDKDQVLVRIGGIGAHQDYASLKEHQTSLLLQAERLHAFANYKTPDFSKIAGDNQKAIEKQQRLLNSARKTYESEKKVIEDQLAQKHQMIERLNSELKAAQKGFKSATELLNMKSSLEKKGAGSRKEVIDSERDVAKMEGEVSAINAKIGEAEQAISEYKNRLERLAANSRDEALQELEAVETLIAQNKETLTKLQERVDRQSIRSPVRGLVKGLRVNTIGGVIGAGEPIMEIVPLDHSLIVEVRVQPREIGNLKVGQPARVKVSAYDFSRYGVIEGEFAFLSATTFVDEKGNSYYKGRIKLSKDHVGPDPKRNLILPGMLVEADIITGEKTILAYLLKPIHRSLDRAFTER